MPRCVVLCKWMKTEKALRRRRRRSRHIDHALPFSSTITDTSLVMWPQHWPMYSINKLWLTEMRNDPAGRRMYIVYNYQVPLQDRQLQIVNKVQINSSVPCVLFLPMIFLLSVLHAVRVKQEPLMSPDISLLPGEVSQHFLVHCKYLSCQKCMKYCKCLWPTDFNLFLWHILSLSVS